MLFTATTAGDYHHIHPLFLPLLFLQGQGSFILKLVAFATDEKRQILSFLE